MFSKLICTEPTYLNHVISLVKHTEPGPPPHSAERW